MSKLFKTRPLASRLRPTALDEIVGQEHLLTKDAPLRKMIEADALRSVILYGPAGTGKTSLAEVIAKMTKRSFAKMNATSASVKDIRSLGTQMQTANSSTVLLYDEIHRSTSVLQDAFLPLVEDGLIVLIGATTENPFMSITSPLLSRCQVFKLEPLTEKHLAKVLIRAVQYCQTLNIEIGVEPAAAKYMIRVCCGDARKLLTLFETCADVCVDGIITETIVKQMAPSKYLVMSDDNSYDLLSWMQGAIQASDPDAAVFALAKLLESGQDPRVLARRIAVSASEDAASSPEAAAVAHSAYMAACEIGRPECDIILAHAVVLIATAKRDKSAAIAIWSALKDVRSGVDIQVPKEMRDSHYFGSEKLGHGAYHDGMDQSKYIGVNKKYYIPWD